MTVVGFTGLKRHGKNTAANTLIDEGFLEVKFAEPLKLMLRTYLGYFGLDGDEIDEIMEGSLKEEPCQFFGGRSARHAQQTLGTEWGRELICSDLWTSAAYYRMRSLYSSQRNVPGFVVTDVRFKNEAEFIRSLNGKLVRVVRPSLLNGVVDLHPSETEIMNLQVDHEFINDGTTLDLDDKVYNWYQENLKWTLGE